MADPVAFKLAVFGRYGDKQAALSAYDYSPEARQLVERVNAELQALPRHDLDGNAKAAALVVLRRHGFAEPDARGWFVAPRGQVSG